jgi:hypothetical protein
MRVNEQDKDISEMNSRKKREWKNKEKTRE